MTIRRVGGGKPSNEAYPYTVLPVGFTFFHHTPQETGIILLPLCTFLVALVQRRIDICTYDVYVSTNSLCLHMIYPFADSKELIFNGIFKKHRFECVQSYHYYILL